MMTPPATARSRPAIDDTAAGNLGAERRTARTLPKHLADATEEQTGTKRENHRSKNCRNRTQADGSENCDDSENDWWHFFSNLPSLGFSAELLEKAELLFRASRRFAGGHRWRTGTFQVFDGCRRFYDRSFY